MTEPAGQDVVLQAQAGNREALAALYDQHYQPVYRYLSARLGDQPAAEDLTGEVFQRMLAGLAGYRAQGLPFRAWLIRIARNVLIDHFRRAGKRAAVALTDALPAVDHDADPAGRVERRLTIERVHGALARLEAAQREAVSLRFLSGLSLRETALALGKSEDAIKALQRRGLAALRAALSGEAG